MGDYRRDSGQSPTDEDWREDLTECSELLSQLMQHGDVARRRARDSVRDGYPTRSMPESDITSGRAGDPTADYVIANAGGRMVDGENTRDTWPGPRDPIGQKVRRMESEVLDARNRLRSAVSALRETLPAVVADPMREECITCGVAKVIATKHGKKPKEWVAADSRCRTCSKRLREYGGRVAPPPQVKAAV